MIYNYDSLFVISRQAQFTASSYTEKFRATNRKAKPPHSLSLGWISWDITAYTPSTDVINEWTRRTIPLWQKPNIFRLFSFITVIMQMKRNFASSFVACFSCFSRLTSPFLARHSAGGLNVEEIEKNRLINVPYV